MARTDEERKKKRQARREDRTKQRKAGRQDARQDRHKTSQDLKQRRVGALDRMATRGVPRGVKAGRPDLRGGETKPQLQPQPQPQVQPQPQPGVLQPQLQQQGAYLPMPQVQPQQPSVGTQMQPAQVFDAQGQAATPDPQWQPQPQLGPPMPPVDPNQLQPAGMEPAPPVEPVGGVTDPVTGEVEPDPELGPGLPPVTAEEAAADNQLGTAVEQGKQFDLGPGPPMAPPEQFQQDLATGGQSAAINPRQIERMRRKRLALLNPKVQQLRPWGRGMPQVRYQGGPAFQGAFQRPQAATPTQPQTIQRTGEIKPQFRQRLV
ncbi:MAG: hypothetical protein ACYSW8_32720, partial [Planctomycetota bacterium]